MSMENDLLVELKRTDKLYNRVIEVFLRKEREDGLCVQISSRFGEYKAFYLLPVAYLATLVHGHTCNFSEGTELFCFNLYQIRESWCHSDCIKRWIHSVRTV